MVPQKLQPKSPSQIIFTSLPPRNGCYSGRATFITDVIENTYGDVNNDELFMEFFGIEIQQSVDVAIVIDPTLISNNFITEVQQLLNDVEIKLQIDNLLVNYILVSVSGSGKYSTVMG